MRRNAPNDSPGKMKAARTSGAFRDPSKSPWGSPSKQTALDVCEPGLWMSLHVCQSDDVRGLWETGDLD